jgi:hypothetical protein
MDLFLVMGAPRLMPLIDWYSAPAPESATAVGNPYPRLAPRSLTGSDSQHKQVLPNPIPRTTRPTADNGYEHDANLRPVNCNMLYIR